MTRSTIWTWRHGSAALASPQNPTAPVDMARTLEMLAVRVDSFPELEKSL